MVTHDLRDALRAQDPLPVELTSTQKHLCKTQVVIDRRKQPAASPEETRVRFEHGLQSARHCSHLAIRSSRIQRGDAVGDVIANAERRAAHFEWLEQLFIEKTI